MNELKVKVAGGYLVVSVDKKDLSASITFQTETDGDIVDLACVEMRNADNEAYYHKHHDDPDDLENYRNIAIHTYGDPYNEDYTHSETAAVDDIIKACEDPDVPTPDSMRC